MNKLGILFLVLSPTPILAHANHKPHVHDEANLTFVMIGDSNKTGDIVFDSPTFTVLGFEHEAKSAVDKKKRDEVVKLFESNFSRLVELDSSKACKVSSISVTPFTPDKEGDDDDEDQDDDSATTAEGKAPIKTAVELHGEHGDFHAQLKFICKKDLSGSSAEIHMADKFPNLGKLNVQILSTQMKEPILLQKGEGQVKF